MSVKPRKKHRHIRVSAPVRMLHEGVVRRRGWMVCGFDTSMSSLAGAAIGYDATLKKYIGPVFVMKRWSKDDHYFTRLNDAARSHDLVLELQHQLGMNLSLDDAWIAQEEPWPLGIVATKKPISGFLKQQAEISGAFLGSLVRYGWKQVSQINSQHWRKMIADDLGITTHYSKWRDPELALRYNCKATDSGKFRSKQWAFGPYMGSFYGHEFPNEIPDWPDLINRPQGLTPRPDDSKAKAVQPDDRYDSLAIMWWLYNDLTQAGLLK